MKEYTYSLTTLSNLIVSPRVNLAFYPESKADIEAIEKQERTYLEKIPKVIYPFYRYGEYDEYAPDHAQYYLPGSSIKGALQHKDAVQTKLMVDDISVPRDAIVLRNIYKAQYLQGKKQACFKAFFENVGVEMVKKSATLKGALYYSDDAEQVKALLKTANDLTQDKIKQMRAYLQELIENKNKDENYKEDFCEKLKKARETLSQLIENNPNVILLGGYKGLLHSIAPRARMPESKGSVFLDPQTLLPYGLVKIKLE